MESYRMDLSNTFLSAPQKLEITVYIWSCMIKVKKKLKKKLKKKKK